MLAKVATAAMPHSINHLSTVCDFDVGQSWQPQQFPTAFTHYLQCNNLMLAIPVRSAACVALFRQPGGFGVLAQQPAGPVTTCDERLAL